MWDSSVNEWNSARMGPKRDVTGELSHDWTRLTRPSRAFLDQWAVKIREAIYGTTPWTTSCEGPTRMLKSGRFTEGEKLAYTPEDYRLTVNGDTLYAIALAWPAREAVIRTVNQKLYPEEIVRITMPGVDGDLRWTCDNTARALRIETSNQAPCRHAFVFRIERRRPFAHDQGRFR